MSEQPFPPGWNAKRAKRLIAHCDSLTDDEQVAEDDAALTEQEGRAVSDAIIREIHQAFHDVAPGPLSLHQAAIVKHADERELSRAKSLDSDLHWSQISEADLQQCSRALYGADAESWRYFIPAFMIWTLRHFRTSDAFLIDQTIYTF
ncbi:MAG TPA: DUF6714 family protein, partial [Lacipirellulaceae bacterium]|nr:DUF6714 family protein [Lacipirellulaceae bacterium]